MSYNGKLAGDAASHMGIKLYPWLMHMHALAHDHTYTTNSN